MVSFTINLETISRVGVRGNKNLEGGMKCKEGIQSQ